MVLAGCQLSASSPNFDADYDSELGFRFSLYLGAVALIDSSQDGRFTLSFDAPARYRGYQLNLYLESAARQQWLARYRCADECGRQQRQCYLERDARLVCEGNDEQRVEQFIDRDDTSLRVELCELNGTACQSHSQRVRLR